MPTTGPNATDTDRALAAFLDAHERVHDWGGWLVDVLAAAYVITIDRAELGDGEGLLAGRPGSWEASGIRTLLDGAGVGEYPVMDEHYRRDDPRDTEPRRSVADELDVIAAEVRYFATRHNGEGTDLPATYSPGLVADLIACADRARAERRAWFAGGDLAADVPAPPPARIVPTATLVEGGGDVWRSEEFPGRIVHDYRSVTAAVVIGTAARDDEGLSLSLAGVAHLHGVLSWIVAQRDQGTAAWPDPMPPHALMPTEETRTMGDGWTATDAPPVVHHYNAHGDQPAVEIDGTGYTLGAARYLHGVLAWVLADRQR